MAARAEEHVVRVVAPDEKGLIHKISAVIVKHDLNVIANDEFVSPNGCVPYILLRSSST